MWNCRRDIFIKNVLLNVCLCSDKCVRSLCGPRVIIIHSMRGSTAVQKVSDSIEAAPSSASRRRSTFVCLSGCPVEAGLEARWFMKNITAVECSGVGGGYAEGGGQPHQQKKSNKFLRAPGERATSGITSWARIANFILKCPRQRLCRRLLWRMWLLENSPSVKNKTLRRPAKHI